MMTNKFSIDTNTVGDYFWETEIVGLLIVFFSFSQKLLLNERPSFSIVVMQDIAQISSIENVIEFPLFLKVPFYAANVPMV